MATNFDPGRRQWVTEFEQTGKRVFRRHPRGIGKQQAEAWEVKRRREIYDRVDLGKVPDVLLQDAINGWLHDNKRKNQKQALSEAKQWETWAKGRSLSEAPEVAAEAVKEWTILKGVPAANIRDARDGRYVPRKASTINRRLMMLKAVCKWAWRKKHSRENLSGRIETLREPPHKDVYLTRAQVATLASSAPSPSCRIAIWLLAYSGLRASELLALTPTHLASGTLTVAASTSKTGKPRTVPVPPHARGYVTSWLVLSSRPSYWELRKQFIVARKKAKLPPTVTLHTLRHTCASWLINAGVDLYTVGRILGHSSAQTTQRYAHLSTQTLEKAMARLK